MYKGKLLGKYRKIMLTGGDKNTFGFTPGSAMYIFEAKGIKFACIICADTSYPEPALMARKLGAVILFSPHYNSIALHAMDAHRIRIRNNHIGIAALTKMTVVRSNVINVSPDRLGYGDSSIFSNHGVPLAEAPLFKETLITAKIDQKMIEESQKWRYIDRIPREFKTKFADVYSNQ